MLAGAAMAEAAGRVLRALQIDPDLLARANPVLPPEPPLVPDEAGRRKKKGEEKQGRGIRERKGSKREPKGRGGRVTGEKGNRGVETPI